MTIKYAVFVAAMLCAATTFAQIPAIDRPKHTMFPGATNPDITPANMKNNICKKGWSTKSIRPPSSYTTALKREQVKNIGYTVKNTIGTVPSKSGTTRIPNIKKCIEKSSTLACYEEDHLISLELGGAPRNPDNLWPEPWFGVWNARVKDKLENTLHDKVCSGDVPLRTAQKEMATDWIAAYQKYIGATP